MQTRQILAAFGGRHELVRLTGATPKAVEQWVRIGIPTKVWPILIERAKRRGIRGITVESLYQAKAGTLGRAPGRAA